VLQLPGSEVPESELKVQESGSRAGLVDQGTKTPLNDESKYLFRRVTKYILPPLGILIPEWHNESQKQ